MSPRSPAATAAGAAALVVVCGVAAYVGASLARGPEAPAPGVPSAASSTMAARLDELERDRDTTRERLRRTEEVSRATLEQVTELRGRLDALAAAPGAAAPAAAAAPTEKRKPPPNEMDPDGTMTPEERAASWAKRVEDDARKFAPMQMRFQFGLWSDTSPEGVESRKRQAWMEARTLAQQVGFSGEKEQALRDAFVAFYEQCSRDLGPAVKEFERADLAAVEATLPRLWTALDAQVKDLVTEEQFKTWTGLVEKPRKLALEIYAEERNKR
jgi:hypothetical protein